VCVPQLSQKLAIDKPTAGLHDECTPQSMEEFMAGVIGHLWSEDRGQDIAEYAVMLAVILVLVVGTIRLIGGNANNAFSAVASSINP